jgi:succinoglycan biosynthesis transport protein ExoP
LSTDPKLAAGIVNSLTRNYIEQTFKTRYETAKQSEEWLSGQLSELQTKTQTSQEKLVRYQRDHGILGIDENQNIVTAKLKEINESLTRATIERINAESLYRIAMSGDPDLVSSLQKSPLSKFSEDDHAVLHQLRGREIEIQNELVQAAALKGPADPKVQQLKDLLEETETALHRELTRIAARLKNDYLSYLQREKMLQTAFKEQQRTVNGLNESAIEYNVLKRDVETSRKVHEALLQRIKEAGVSAGLRSSNVRIVDYARTPYKPAEPDVPRNLITSLLLGLIGGLGLAFVFETLDYSVRTPEHAQLLLGLPSLGVIPKSANPDGRDRQPMLVTGSSALCDTPPRGVELVCHSRPTSEIAESYRALGTSLLLSSLGKAPKLILVTSAMPEEGKTTTSINSAIVLAQRGSRVLLVDADLRRPTVHRALNLSGKVGLSSVLTGTGTLADAIAELPDIANLCVLPAGPTPPQPAELLGSDLMRNVLRECRRNFDHIIIAVPKLPSQFNRGQCSGLRLRSRSAETNMLSKFDW